MTAGELFKKLRERKLISQAEVAEELGTTQQFVSNVERGLCPMPAHLLYLASQLFNTDCDKLINAMSRDYKQRLKSDVKKNIA